MNRASVDVTFREASRADAREVAAIIFGIICEDGTPSGLEPMTRDHVVEWFDRLEDRGAIFLAEVDDLSAGFSVIEPDPQRENVAVLRVYVLKEFRQRGIGRELAQVAVEFAREAGYETGRGFIPESNEEALSFFSAVAPLVQVQGGQFHFEL
ncbi:MAG: GNAT family N-acetyltransferase [Dehalococcoidia bacterium]